MTILILILPIGVLNTNDVIVIESAGLLWTERGSSHLTQTHLKLSKSSDIKEL